MEKQKVIMHLDMDAFFASCLQVKYPELRNKPVVVSYNQSKSIIVTSSYEARAMGVKTGMPLFKAKEITNNQVIQANPEFKLFTTISEAVFSTVYNEFSNLIEIASIDECYIDVTNKWEQYGTPKKMAIAMKNRIKEKLGLTCSIGVSSNKFLAKMVGKVNKPDGVTIINPKNYKTFLWNMPIEDMFGIGAALAKRMHKLDINTVKDLALKDDESLIKEFGKIGLSLKQNALGKGSDKVIVEHNDYKNISNEITLEFPVTDEEEILDILAGLTKHVLDRADRRKLISNTLGITIRYKWNKEIGEEFDKSKHHKVLHHQRKLSEYTTDLETIYINFKDMLLTKFDIEKGISLIGISLKNTIKIDKLPKQLSIDDQETINPRVKNILDNPDFKKVLKTGDKIENKKGKLSGQTKYIKKEEIHFNPKAK